MQWVFGSSVIVEGYAPPFEQIYNSFMVLIGELAGLACGFILSVILVFVINQQSFGWTFIYRVDWGALSTSLPLIILTALGASLPALRLIFKQSPAAVLRT